MKQAILAALLLASSTSLFAQKETEKIEFRPHWYMQVQGGIGHTIGEGKFSDLVSPGSSPVGRLPFYARVGIARRIQRMAGERLLGESPTGV